VDLHHICDSKLPVQLQASGLNGMMTNLMINISNVLIPVPCCSQWRDSGTKWWDPHIDRMWKT